MLKMNREQAEIIYNSLLQTLRACNIDFDSKHEQLQNVITNRHDATDVLDQLDIFYEFIISENDISFDEEKQITEEGGS